jgi:modulator of FtsH protease
MSAAYIPAVWSSFFSALVSASASLTGLLFVAVSINLGQIVRQQNLVSRAAKALFALVSVLLAAVLCLAPAQSVRWLGVEILLLGLLFWAGATRAERRATHDNPFVSSMQRAFHFTMMQCSALPFIVAGLSLLTGLGGGLYWLVAGAVFSLVAALIDAWVLLIEIQR